MLSNHNIKVIKIDPEIPYYELENLFRDKDKLQERLRIEGNTLKVLRQLTPDEARQEVQNGFLLSANEGVKKYLSYQKILTPWQAKEIFSQHLKTVASLFKEEGVNESEFEKLLEVLDNLSDQKLNQDWIKELLNTKEHDESWASLALEYFRKKYPQELWFHKTAAEFNFKLGVYDYAREAYQAALDLKPNDKQLKEMVKRCERMLRQQKEEVQKRIIQEFNQIWNNLIQNRNFESAKVLLDKFPSATLAELLKNKIPPRYEPLNKVYHALKILKETAEQTKNYSLLSLLDHYQLQLLSDLFEHVVKGHVINQEMLEVLRIIVESDEFVVPSLMPKIEKTLTTDDHRNKELCSFIMNYLFSRHLLNGHKLFQEGQVKEAMSEFDLALEAYPDSSLALAEKGSAYLVLGQVEPAEELLEKALKYDPNNFIALDRLIWIGISKNDLHKVIELAMRVLAGEEREGWEKIRKVARKTALLNLPYAYLRLWDESQEENLLESAQKYALQLQVE
ncbi:MAG: tetratricopeptide repeat protein, partial [Candidatus Margulisiibacteriota bacterium]